MTAPPGAGDILPGESRRSWISVPTVSHWNERI